jgi:hypothetical protein
VDGIRHTAMHLSRLKSLVERAPAFELALGRDLLDDPIATITRVLSGPLG